MYEIGDGMRVVPLVASDGSYLTRSCCFLFKQGVGEVPRNSLPVNNYEIAEFPGGWKFICVEIGLGITPEQLKSNLLTAKTLLEEKLDGK